MADIPNLDAFSLVTSGQSFVPSAATEALVTKQRQLLVDTYGAKGQQIIDDAQAGADGVNAYWAAHGINQPPATVNDVIAVTAFIGSIFGSGGGGEAVQRRPAREAAGVARPDQGPQGLGRRHARRRQRGADDDHEALQLPAAHGRPGDRVGRARRELDPEPGPASAGRNRGRGARAQGGVELPDHGAPSAPPPATHWQ